MRKWGIWHHSRLIVAIAAISLCFAPAAFAQTASSDNYQMTESEFGSISNKQTCSGQYCATTSLGTVSGNSASPTSSASFGPITPDQPTLDIIIDMGISDLGDLSAERTSTKTSTIRVLSYLSNGYVVQITGDPPKYKNHTFATPSTPTASLPGTEQFAINATANTDPNVGASPVQVPDEQTSFGFVTDDYNIPNRFKYQSGDVVARSLRSSGRTDYTVSFIVNISNATPAGKFTGDYSAVVIPTY